MLLPFLLAFLLASVLAAGDAPPPPAAQKLVDDAAATVAKARLAFDAAAKKEQEKLVAALTKEQEKETKKGNLDAALAIKALIEQVQAGLLQQKADESGDLLGDGGKAPPPGTAADLLTDCPVPAATARASGAPKALEAVLARCSGIALPKGDRNRYAFRVAAAGTVVVLTGSAERNHADIWPELLKAGFKRIDDTPWFALEARPGMQFALWDPPMAGAQLQVFAGRFRPAR